MASPSSTIQRPDLGLGYQEFSLASHMAGFRGMEILPPVQVAVSSGNFSKVLIEELLRDDRNPVRAPGAEYARDHTKFTQDSFVCRERGLEEVLDRQELEQFAYTGLMFEQMGADRSLAGTLRHLEREQVGLLQATGTFSNSGVNNEWDDHANATPINDVAVAVEAFRSNCGYLPNVMALSGKQLRHLKRVDEIVDRLKYSGIDDPKNIDEMALAALFGIERLVVFDSLRNTAAEGATASLADIWDDEYVGFYRVSSSPDLKGDPRVGATFQFQGVMVEQYEEARTRADIIRARLSVGPKIIHPECGYLLSNIIS